MNLAELRAIVRQGESEKVEFKRSTGQRTDAAKTVCAMLNGAGGFVIFGVAPDGSIVGQEIGARTLEDVTNCISQIEPPAFPDIETVSTDHNATVIVLRVPGGGLFTYEGRPYIRYGPTTRVMPREEYERKLVERLHEVYRWENQPAHEHTIDDLDHNEIQLTINESVRRGRMDEPPSRSIPDLLQGLHLLRNGQLLNAAVVLFAKRDKLPIFYPQCLLKLAYFKGINRSEFIDNQQVIGNAFELLARGQQFLRAHLPIAGRIVPDSFERIDEPLYPPVALREAIANAICHRNYSISAGAISIAIYDDRLEIQSTGSLPFGLTPGDLARPHPSRPWNPLIAQVFYRRGIIEAWGRGTLQMIELTEKAGLVAPEFESSQGEVTVRFHPIHYSPPSRVNHDLSPLQRNVLQVLAATGPSAIAQLHGRMSESASLRTLQWNLAFLSELGLIEKRGRGRYTQWQLRDQHPVLK